jgi:DNA-binding NarL/FixJ family response regulator
VKSARVHVKREDNRVSLTVADDGIGFDPAQLGDRRTLSGQFGLYHVRERLQLLGGSMEIESSPGQGSRFTLMAPLPTIVDPSEAMVDRPAKVSVVLTSPPKTPQDQAPAKIRIVLVEDHIVTRQGLAGLLRLEPDMEIVGEASDAESGLSLIREIHPDVVLMDIGLPGMNGIEATRLIHAELPNVHVIGLSMFEEAERAAAMRQAGAVNYLTKSGPSDKVIAAIRSAGCYAPAGTSKSKQPADRGKRRTRKPGQAETAPVAGRSADQPRIMPDILK